MLRVDWDYSAPTHGDTDARNRLKPSRNRASETVQNGPVTVNPRSSACMSGLFSLLRAAGALIELELKRELYIVSMRVFHIIVKSVVQDGEDALRCQSRCPACPREGLGLGGNSLSVGTFVEG